MDGRAFEAEELKSALRRQIRLNLGTNLFYGRHPSNMVFDPVFLYALRSLRRVGKDAPVELVRYAADCTEEALYETNQYIDLDEGARRTLRSLYRETFRRMESGEDVLGCLRCHHHELASCVETLYPAGFPALLRESPILGRVTCAEYSPSTIASIYGIEPSDLHEPILDVGCGRSAGFVGALSDMGKEIVGFDRSAEGDRTNVLRAGWFDFEYGSREWGTILANMSYTNHMRYHLVHGTSRRDAYIDTYDRICSSLAEGGSFHYAPCVPEAESLLNTDEFSVEHRDSGIEGIATACVKRISVRGRRTGRPLDRPPVSPKSREAPSGPRIPRTDPP